jgi:lipopolysaccharide/colanic/teichoic acid biosynthesis glycosyltransferase
MRASVDSRERVSRSTRPRPFAYIHWPGIRAPVARPLYLAKLLMDVAFALLLGAIALPVVACAAMWIRLVSPGAAFYTQEREGEHGQSIWIWKLRTMHPNAETELDHVLSASPGIRSEWTCHFKLRHDPRVLPGIGGFLRKTCLDELPQLWNVLKGEMSLVGPRPFPLYHVEQFSPRFRELRTTVRPGLTGLWQVSDRSADSFAAQEALDTYYIRNWSLWLDLYMIARTVRAVLFARGI